jgi:hypothetical protein
MMVGCGVAAQCGFPRIAYEDSQTIVNLREAGISDYEEIYRIAFSREKR